MFNPFNKLLEAFRRKSYLSTGQVFAPSSILTQRPTNKDYLDSFDTSALVHSCVDKISKKVANTKFRLYKVGGRSGKEQVVEIKDHLLLDLLSSFNPRTTKHQMLQLMQAHKELLGNAYWYKARGQNTKKVLELWPLRADKITVKQIVEKNSDTGEQTEKRVYKYRTDIGEVVAIPEEDIIPFYQLNPKDDIYGSPTVKAAMDIIKSSVYATRWNRNFFDNSAVPDTLLISKTAMTTDQKKEFRERWEDKYQGYANAHKIGILEGEVDIKQLAGSLRDMDFSNLINTDTEQILLAFGVPKSILGIQGMNRAEAEAQIYAFLSETIEPKVQEFVETLNQYLVPEFGDNLYLWFDDPTPENREAVVKEYELGLQNHWLLINEVRDKEGLLPIKGGWDFYLPISMVSAGGEEKPTGKMMRVGGTTAEEYKAFKKEKEQEELRNKILAGRQELKLKMVLKDEIIKQLKLKKLKPFSQKQRRAWWEGHNAVLKSDEKLFKVFVRKLLKNQEGRIKDGVVSTMRSKGLTKSLPKFINWDIENRIFFELSVPLYTDITQRRGKRAGDLIGTRFELTNEVMEGVNKKATLFSERVNKTTRKKLEKELKQGVKMGEDVSQLENRVTGVFKVRSKDEAERIARTEVNSASNAAELDAYKQSGVIKKKEWLAEPDACPICADLDGQQARLSESFDGFDTPPAHANCRCTILPVIET